METKKLKSVAKTFDQDEDDVPSCIGYYVGMGGFCVEEISHPAHLWTLLDRIESNIITDEEELNLNKNQISFLLHFLAKWKNEISKYTEIRRNE